MNVNDEEAGKMVRQMILESLPAGLEGNPTIFGPGGALDSLGLVNLLSDLEYRSAEVFGKEIVIASERAMSRSKSPFHDVTSLSDYIVELLRS